MSNSDLVAISPDRADYVAVYQFVMRRHAAMHDLQGWLGATKYVKEAVLATFVLLAVAQVTKARPTRPFALSYGGIFLLGLTSAVATMLTGSWFALVAGGRTFAAWFLGATAAPLVDEGMLRTMARVFALTLLSEAILVAIELPLGMWTYTIVMFDHDLVRAVGTFNLPVSLATFAVVAWSAVICWGELSRRSRWVLTMAMLFVLVFAASGTAWAAFAASLATMLFARVQQRWRSWLLLATLPAALVAWAMLPDLTGRWDIHDSLWGRILPVQVYASEHLSTRQVLFGTRLGLGTNALAPREEAQQAFGATPDRPVGDSTPAVVFWQIGLVGLVLVYSLFGLALRADPDSRALGMVLLVSSLAVNITELFPVNLILGFWLANAARKSSPRVAD